MAAEQNREVFAIPGSPLDERARGSNKLLKQGVHLAETAEDIIHALPDPARLPLSEPDNPFLNAPPPDDPDEHELAPLRAHLMELLGPTPIEVDELVRALEAPAHFVSVLLLELDLAGRLAREPGGKVALSQAENEGLSF